MKSLWKGSLSFGLVSIPVALYAAIRSQVLGFKLLCGSCQHPIEYERWCPTCKKEVSWDNTVKGLKLKSGKYLVLTQEKIKELKPEKTDTIDIFAFVDGAQMEIIYFDSHYYVAPTKKNEKSYFLFAQALTAAQKIAVGKFVMRDRERLCAITPYHNGLLLTTLHYAYEIRSLDAVPLLTQDRITNKQELGLALDLIKKLEQSDFHLADYKETFAQELLRLLQKGKAPRLTVQPKKTVRKKESLLADLKASISQSTKVSKKRKANA